MKPEIKQRWITALKSDEYKQTQRYLKTQEGFCCLGVLTDLYLQEIGDLWHPENDGDKICYSFNDCAMDLPQGVVEWAGLACDDPTVTINGVATELSALNDEGTNFQEIAKLIESSLTEELYPELFTENESHNSSRTDYSSYSNCN